MDYVKSIALLITIIILISLMFLIIPQTQNCDYLPDSNLEAYGLVKKTGDISLNNPQGMAIFQNQLYVLNVPSSSLFDFDVLQTSLRDNLYYDDKIWIADSTNSRIIVYDTDGIFLPDLTIDVPGTTYVQSILRIGDFFYIFDYSTTAARAFDSSGVYTPAENFNINTTQVRATALTDNYIYIIAQNSGTAYAYDIDTKSYTPAENITFEGVTSNTWGMTFVDNVFYLVDPLTNSVKAFDLNGVSLPNSNFDLISDNSLASGITFNDGYFYVNGIDKSKVFVYEKSGSRPEVGEFFRWDYSNRQISNKINLGFGSPLPLPTGLGAFENHLIILEPSYNYMVQYDINSSNVVENQTAVFQGTFDDTFGLSATENNIFIVSSKGEITRYDIDYISRTATNPTMIGDANLVNAQGISVQNDKIYIVDSSIAGLYSFDYDGSSISNKQLLFSTHFAPTGVSSSLSDILIIDSISDHIDIFSEIPIPNQWKQICLYNMEQANYAVSFLILIVMIIALVILMFVFKSNDWI